MPALPTPADDAQSAVHEPRFYSSTPVRKSLQGSEPFASKDKHDADLLKVKMAEELAGQWVGPMPVQTFIETFLELDAGTLALMPKFKSNHFDSLAQEDLETSMYDPFIKAVEASGALRNKFKLVNTSDNPDPNALNSMKNKPDVSCYESGLDVESNPTNFEEMELILEFKPYKQPADPFDDNGKAGEGVVHPFEPISNKSDVHCAREKCRGQLASYTRVWSSRQHRTHCFLLWLGDPDARIIRMDRSGGIVSATFNYRTEGHFLLQFLWRFSQSTPAARGRDTTVAKASKEETEKATKILKEARFIPSSDRSVLKVQVPDAKQKTRSRSFLVWGPLADPRSATGRATRGYPAVDLEGNSGKGTIVFLKDSWRSCEEGMEKESAILDDLNTNHCQNVPELICGDDIEEHLTVTKTYAKEVWNIGGKPKDIVQRVHTRFTQKQVGYHLDGFKSSKEFLQAVFDAFLAHKDAYEKCGILHRDISAGNILMRENGCGGGFLNDWDLAKRIKKDLVVRQPFRSGTWQFMSALLLEKPDKNISLQDDLESFLWLVLYHILRYMNHNRPQNLRKSMKTIFDEEHDGDAGQQLCGGWGKQQVLNPTRGPLGLAFSIESNPPLTLWIRTMLDSWEEWYSLVTANRRAVRRAVEFLGMSVEEAMEQHPFDDRNSPMRNYDETVFVFKKILNMATWPESDMALDALSPHPHPQVKRGRESEGITEHNTTTDPDVVENPTEDRAVLTNPPKKPKKTSEKLKDKDDDAYRPSPLRSGVVPLVFSGRETRGNEKPQGAYTEQDSESE